MASFTFKTSRNVHRKEADLVSCQESVAPPSTGKPVVNTIILDGSAVANILKPINAKTFGEYANNVYLSFIKRQLRDASRVDVISDVSSRIV